MQRRSQIADWVRERGSARVGELSEFFKVSEVTIRNDLAQLEKENQLVRDRGGAIASSDNRELTSLLAVEQRAHLQTSEKQSIARLAAGMVKPGDTIIMDAGTTIVEMVPFLSKITPLRIVTNALNVALEAGAATDAEIILVGGSYNREASSTLGPWAERAIGDLIVDKLFLGAQALDAEHGLTDTTIEIAQVKQAMLRVARQKILLTDSSKWAQHGFIKVAPLTAVHTLISDRALPEAAQTAIQKLGIELRLA
ncbi:MAG: DeoR/GlpR family DNA-binding transcription regulator [Chthoniobacteraceae bacterium]